MLAITHPPVLPSAMLNGVGTPVAIISQLNTLPALPPVNASMATLRPATHDSGPGWLATPFLYDSFIHNSTPVLSRRTQQPAKRTATEGSWWPATSRDCGCGRRASLARKMTDKVVMPRLRGTNVRPAHVSALIIALLMATRTPACSQANGAQTPEAREAAARYAAADIRVMAPGVVYNAGLLDLAEAYTKQTGKKVAVTLVGKGSLVNAVETADPPADTIMLPFEMMSTLSLDGGIVPDSFTPLGRAEMGLAVRAGAPHPDISSIEKLAAVLRGAKAVMRSSPAGGSMVAKVIEDKVIKRPEFAGVISPVSTRGEGGEALARGEGDMALQAICEILPHKEIELVGTLPRELGAWIDMSTAVSARAMHRGDALAFIQHLLRPESNAVWKAKALERFH